MHVMRAHTRRRSFAISAVLLWLLGVEVLPSIHLATHTHDHTHAADGTMIFEHHELDDDHDGPSQLAFDHVPHGHAAAGIAHHATALHQPPPPILTPVTAPIAETWTHAAPTARVSIAHASRPTARGPPVA